MTVNEMQQDIGQTYRHYIASGCRVDFEIVDVRMSYGRKQWKIVPKQEDGFIWVNAN